MNQSLYFLHLVNDFILLVVLLYLGDLILQLVEDFLLFLLSFDHRTCLKLFVLCLLFVLDVVV